MAIATAPRRADVVFGATYGPEGKYSDCPEAPKAAFYACR
jgi:hypothetical protein